MVVREKAYASRFPEILDYDFIFAEDFLDDQADLTIANIGRRPCGSSR